MMFSMQGQGGYHPLRTPDVLSSSEELGAPYIAGPDEQWLHLVSRFVQLATVTIIVCTIVDSLILLYLSVQLYRPTALPDAKSMELRSSYINLDVLYSKGNISSSKHDSVVNHALSFAQVSMSEPSRILPTYRTGYFKEEFGPVPWIERRLLVTPQISTVAQFRAIDFGMESCSLAIGVPLLNGTSDKVMSSQNLKLDVYTLPIREQLNLRTVSHSSLPTTKTLLTQLALSEDGVVQTPTFTCRTLSYHTFLLACSDLDCHIDLIGTTQSELGLFMYQHQTI